MAAVFPDRGGFEAVYRELAGHRPYLMRVALQRLRDPQRAEDAVQDTLLAALDGAGRFAGRSALRTWLTGILIHKVHDAHRAAAREEHHVPLEEDWEDFEGAEQGALPSGAWADPEAALDAQRLRTAFDRALAELPPRQAQAFMLREIAGHDTAPICRLLDVSPANLWVLLFRARAGLRAALTQTGDGP